MPTLSIPNWIDPPITITTTNTKTTKSKPEFGRSCSMCGDTFELSTVMVKDSKYKKYCPQCYPNVRWSYCSSCGLAHTNYGEPRCFACSHKYDACDICGGVYHKGNMAVNQYKTIHSIKQVGIKACQVCKNNQRICIKCGKSGWGKDLVDAGFNFLCHHCNAIIRGSSSKHKHDYRPPVFVNQGSSDLGLFIGVENEMLFGTPEGSYQGEVFVHKRMVEINKQYTPNILYIKHDGSIGGPDYGGSCGFEVVLHPQSFSNFQQINWDSLFTPGVSRNSTCGMHIHLNKSAFNTLHLYKFLGFIYKNPTFIKRIGERPFNKYCRMNPIENLKIDSRTKWFDRGQGDCLRRQAVNLSNKHTVELRFFANAATSKTLHKNVEFAHALFKFTQEANIKASCNVDRFRDFVAGEDKRYDNLLDFLNLS